MTLSTRGLLSDIALQRQHSHYRSMQRKKKERKSLPDRTPGKPVRKRGATGAMKGSPSTDPRIAITAAAHAEIERLSRLVEQLPSLDRDVAKQAMDTLESAEGAASWLLDDNHRALRGSPVELSRSADGKAEVLKVLGRIEHGVLL